MNNVLQHLLDLWFSQLQTIYVKWYPACSTYVKWYPACSTRIAVSFSDMSITVSQYSKHKTHTFYMEYKNDIDLIGKISFYDNLLSKLNESTISNGYISTNKCI